MGALTDLNGTISGQPSDEKPQRFDWDIWNLPTIELRERYASARHGVEVLRNHGFKPPECWYVHPSNVSLFAAIWQAYGELVDAREFVRFLIDTQTLFGIPPLSDVLSHNTQKHPSDDERDPNKKPIPSFEEVVAGLGAPSAVPKTAGREEPTP
jgi:hypothetical protein